jgi:hypothetical protein
MSGKIDRDVLKKLAHCKCCSEPMMFIYDLELRPYCYECCMEMQIEYAKEILGYGQ